MYKKSIYIWEAPLRINHWVNVILIGTLVITGLYIGDPIFGKSGETSANFLMGRVRLWHSMAAWLFIANFIFRIYWRFAGNDFARFNPFKKGFFTDALGTVKYYLFLKKEHTLPTEHNALAQLTYFFAVRLGSLFMILTGLALQGEIQPGALQAKLAGWMIPLFNGSYALRSWHHLVTWVFIAFVVVHMYMVFRQDILDDDSTLSSMINGHKFALPDPEKSHDHD